MHIMIAGTDTNIGKTVVSSWLCLQTSSDYFKPIQSGDEEGTDSERVAQYTNAKIHPEIYRFKAPLSPHLAARLENQSIELSNIHLPSSENLIVECAGGLFSPLNDNAYNIDLIQYLKLPVILVTMTRLGSINQLLLSLEALRSRHIPILGFILLGEDTLGNGTEIEHYGKIPLLANIPFLPNINKSSLQSIPLSIRLQTLYTQTNLSLGNPPTLKLRGTSENIK